jgi:hypothetical protein
MHGTNMKSVTLYLTSVEDDGGWSDLSTRLSVCDSHGSALKIQVFTGTTPYIAR